MLKNIEESTFFTFWRENCCYTKKTPDFIGISMFSGVFSFVNIGGISGICGIISAIKWQ